MSDSRLVRRLAVVAHRRRRLSRLKLFSLVWFTTGALWVGVDLVSPAGAPIGIALVIAAAGIALSFWYVRARNADLQQAALLLEHHYGSLDSRLLTALGQARESGASYSFLQEQVLSDVVDHARRHPWAEAVPTRRLRAWQVVHLAAMIAFAATLAWASRSGSPGEAEALDARIADGGSAEGLTVEPGDVELELGSSLIVTARFPEVPPESADLVTTDPEGNSQRWPLSRSLDDPLFGGRIPEIRSDLTYRVESRSELSDDYEIKTFEFPALVQADAIVAPPQYARRGEERTDDVRRVSVYEGSTLTFVCRFNKPLASAVLQPGQGDPLAFGRVTPALETSDDADDVSASLSWRPQASQTLELIVADDAGRGLKNPVSLHVEVLPNLPPELAVTFPSRDVQVSPLEELALEATAWDDFGLQELGLVYRLPSGEERSILLGAGGESSQESETKLEHLLPLEDIDPAARDLLSYSFYADDFDAEGSLRRTYSDVFFAEVRHFDEEYREQRGQPGGGGGGGGQPNPAQQLVDLQRQIVIATWNSFRNWTSPKVVEQSSKYRDEIRVIADSQLEAGKQAEELSEKMEDAVAKQHAALAGEHMTATHDHLTSALEVPSAEPLTAARTAAQSAYQELLRLRDRLHTVKQQSGGGGGGGGSAAMDRQLSQLELRNDRNRYEQESQAQNPQEQQDHEQLDVLARLRELAQRQEDLNERIKELLDERRTARTGAEREEIERELKRLRDEQQELLHDADQLRERMMQPQNQRQMADAREQLDQTRSDLQRAAESLDAGQASRALTSGTRAQQRLQEMKDEFRRRTAGAFDESVRELQQDVRELADRQRAIGEELQSADGPGDAQPTLRDSDRRADVGESLGEQRERLSSLLERMRDLVEQSEASEPLLSEHLYDAILDGQEERPQEALRAAQELLRRGFAAEGTAAEQQARHGIERLEEGINTAADSILGDELESLQRAEEQVADLARALEGELAQSQPKSGDGGPRPARERPEGRSDEQGSSSPGGVNSGDSPAEEPAKGPSDGQDDPGNREGDRQPEPTPSEQTGAPQPGSGGRGGAEGEQSSNEAPNRPADGNTLTDAFRSALGGAEESAGTNRGSRPLTGQDFTGWSNQLREVEDMLSAPELRAQAGSIRERARDVRREFKRHSKSPDWPMVRTEIYGPLLELQLRLADEIARRQPQDNVVPIDRDPVPEQYSDLVREYYEKLSRTRRQTDHGDMTQ